MNSDHVLQELQKCKKELVDAERRAAAAIESRDAIAIKLEEARDEIAELQRRQESHKHFHDILSKEIDSKDKLITKTIKEASHTEQALNTARDIADKLNESIVLKEKEQNTTLKTVVQLELEVNRQKEDIEHLKRKVVQEQAQHSALQGLIRNMQGEKLSLKQELDVATKQLRAEEGAHQATKAALRSAIHQISDAEQSTKAMKAVLADADTLRCELSKLGREVIKEQKIIMDHESKLLLNNNKAQHGGGSSSSSGGEDIKRKISLLQKRLIAESEKVIKQDRMLKEKEKEINAMKMMMQRRSMNNTSLSS